MGKYDENDAYIFKALERMHHIIKESSNEKITSVDYNVYSGDLSIQLSVMSNKTILKLLENIKNC